MHCQIACQGLLPTRCNLTRHTRKQGTGQPDSSLQSCPSPRLRAEPYSASAPSTSTLPVPAGDSETAGCFKVSCLPSPGSSRLPGQPACFSTIEMHPSPAPACPNARPLALEREGEKKRERQKEREAERGKESRRRGGGSSSVFIPKGANEGKVPKTRTSECAGIQAHTLHRPFSATEFGRLTKLPSFPCQRWLRLRT